MKKHISLLLLLIFTKLNLLGIGLGEFESQTPGGNFIGNSNGLIFRFHNENIEEDFDFDSWYFYKGYIIFRKDNVDVVVVNEKQNKILDININGGVAKFISDNQLKPQIWLRTYSDNWNTTELISLYFLFSLWIMIPLLFLYLLLIRLKILPKPNTRVILNVSLFAIIIFVFIKALDYYPQSF